MPFNVQRALAPFDPKSDFDRQLVDGISPDDIRSRAAGAAATVLADHWRDCLADGMTLDELGVDVEIVNQLLAAWLAHLGRGGRD